MNWELLHFRGDGYMCGIIGIVIGKRYSNEEMKKVKDLFTQVLVAHEERGREATGVAAIFPDSKYIIKKAPVPASEFVKSKEYSNFLKQVTKNTGILLGHTRKPTKGSQWNSENNHPIVTGDTIGVHNGTIKNDDFLFKYEGFSRNSEVDSEVIFSLLNKVNYEDFSGQFVSDVQKSTRKLTGSFTTISLNLKHPSKILVLKYDQPLSYHYSRSLETLFFTSRYVFLRKAFGRSVVTEALPGKTGFLFDLTSESGIKGEYMRKFPIESSDDFLKLIKRED